MLNSLYIKNYRNLRELKIDSVAQVNLLCGKNNIGKSSVLETLAIYASKNNIVFLTDILKKRGEYEKAILSKDNSERNMNTLSSIFTDEEITTPIFIGTVEGVADMEKNGISEYCTRLRFIKYVEEIQPTSRIKRFLQENDDREDAKIGFEITHNNLYATHYLENEIESRFAYKISISENCQFVWANNNNINDKNSLLFDKISLANNKKQTVIDALKIIDARISNLSYIADQSNEERKPKVILDNFSEIKLLTRMGDGINRILTIILAAVNCENGFLLIDEFENGLHYSVQENLWKIIFKLAKDLNIQVFATTHSNDCINSFSKIVNEENNGISGQLIRLDNINDEIKPEIIKPEILKIATEQNIEIR